MIAVNMKLLAEKLIAEYNRYGMLDSAASIREALSKYYPKEREILTRILVAADEYLNVYTNEQHEKLVKNGRKW